MFECKSNFSFNSSAAIPITSTTSVLSLLPNSITAFAIVKGNVIENLTNFIMFLRSPVNAFAKIPADAVAKLVRLLSVPSKPPLRFSISLLTLFILSERSSKTVF